MVVKAQKGEAEWHTKFGVHLIAAGLTAATLLGQPSIAEAGVVIEQPKTKKVFQGGPRPPKPAETEVSEGGGLQLPSIGLPSISLPSISLPSIGLPALPEFSGLNITPVETLDPRTVALPGAILGITGVAYLSYKYDAGFRSMIREGMVKDSNDFAGYEEDIDEYAAQAAGQISKGTKKISKAVKKTGQKAKKGFFSFGKK